METHNVMVCVTSARTCDKLINRAMEREGENNLLIVHCVETGRNFMGTPYEADAVEYLFTAAQVAGAELSLLRAPDVDDALVEYATEQDVDVIIMGASPTNLDHDTITVRLQRRLPNVEFDIVH